MKSCHYSHSAVAACSNIVAGRHVPEWKQILTRRLVYMLFGAYTLMMLQPVMPVIIDGMAHTFWNSRHMLTVHEEHGKFHVHQELANTSRQSEKERLSGNYKYEIECCLNAAVTLQPSLQQVYATVVAYPNYLCYYPSSCTAMDYPPPRA